jgi:poly-gamma-glutamate synthesis protein (capsule biosynthesis protein)
MASCSKRTPIILSDVSEPTTIEKVSSEGISTQQAESASAVNESIPNEDSVSINHEIKETSLAIVGDIMFHNTQLYRAYNSETKTYRFNTIFKYMEPYLRRNDLTFGNLETVLFGPYEDEFTKSNQNYFGYSGFPYFNTPDSVIEPFLSSGFDFLSTANNHCLDRGYDGMVRTIEKLDHAGINHTGTFSDVNNRRHYELIESNGITFAVVNYTYSTNHSVTNQETMELVNTLDSYRNDLVERLYSDVEAAEKSEADFVICMLHYGNEYWPNEDQRFQKPLTLELIKRGADIVLGGHAHVLEPIDIIYEVDEIKFEDPKVIIYSLGNFIASQRDISIHDANTDIGVMFNIYFETIDGNNPKMTGIGLLPTYTIWQSDVIATIPVTEDLSLLKDESLNMNEYNYSNWDDLRIAFAKEYTIDHLMQYILPKNIVGESYNDQGIIRYDIIRD